MRKKWGPSGRKPWGLFVAAAACLLMFQNMSSPNDQPAAENARPPDDLAQYLPPQPHGNSPGALADEILDYNFGEGFRQFTRELEEKYGHWLKPSFSMGDDESGGNLTKGEVGTGIPKPRANYGFSLLNVGTLGFSYDGGVRLRCEYSLGSRALQVSVNKNFGPRSELVLRHTTDDRRSSLSYSYRW